MPNDKEYEIGETWVHPFTGKSYTWDGEQWVRDEDQSKAIFDPLGFLNIPTE